MGGNLKKHVELCYNFNNCAYYWGEGSMERKEKKNQGLMKAIKAVHSIVENDNIDKQRQSQETIGMLYGKDKEILFEDFEIDGMQAEWVRVDRPHIKKYVILYCHGGGYMTGGINYCRTLTTKLAKSTSMDVLSFDYRLAPEYPYPSALEDGLKAWDYLMYLGYGSRDVIIVGDSAGGNLAFAMTLKLREQNRLLPRGIIGMSPWTDMTCSGHSHEKKKGVDPILDSEYLDKAIKSYAPEEDLSNPLISPLFADFTGFPPVYLQVGSNEILLDDTKMIQKKLIADNVSVKMDVYRGKWHVFQMSPFKEAYDAIDKIAEFIFSICR